MAKRRRSRKAGHDSFVALPVKETLVLGNLADATVTVASGQVLAQDLFLISMDLQISIGGHTPSEGPLQVGIAEEDLTGAEISEKLDAAPTHQHDVPAVEQAARHVRSIGTFPGLLSDEVLNDGRNIRTTIKWKVRDGAALFDFWLRNESGGALTTGTVVEIIGTAYAKWL